MRLIYRKSTSKATVLEVDELGLTLRGRYLLESVENDGRFQRLNSGDPEFIKNVIMAFDSLMTVKGYDLEKGNYPFKRGCYNSSIATIKFTDIDEVKQEKPEEKEEKVNIPFTH